MKRTLEIEDGIIDGDIKRFLESHFTSDTISFKQRKSYDEYYHQIHKDIEIDLFLLDILSKTFEVVINSWSIKLI